MAVICFCSFSASAQILSKSLLILFANLFTFLKRAKRANYLVWSHLDFQIQEEFKEPGKISRHHYYSTREQIGLWSRALDRMIWSRNEAKSVKKSCHLLFLLLYSWKKVSIIFWRSSHVQLHSAGAFFTPKWCMSANVTPWHFLFLPLRDGHHSTSDDFKPQCTMVTGAIPKKLDFWKSFLFFSWTFSGFSPLYCLENGVHRTNLPLLMKCDHCVVLGSQRGMKKQLSTFSITFIYFE